MIHKFILSIFLGYAAYAGLPPTSTKGSGDATAITTFQINTPSIPITHSGTVATLGTVAVGGGGTGQTTYTDGQILIGNSATGGLAKAALTAGSNVTITNGNGTISIAATSGSGGATFWGTLTYTGASNCTWETTASTSFAAFPADTDCNAASVTSGSNVSAPATKIPALTFTVTDYATSAYLLVATGSFGMATGTPDSCAMRFSDGTDSSVMALVSSTPATTTFQTLVGNIIFTSNGAKTVNIQGRDGGGDTGCRIAANVATGTPMNALTINVYKVPLGY